MAQRTVDRFLMPAAKPGDWAAGLASPGHWKAGYSAHALAHTWQPAGGFPPAVRAALDTDQALAGLEFLLGLPEHRVPLPGGTRASQTDLLVLAKNPARELVVIAVEGKAEEPFGDSTVAGWRREARPGKQERLAFLLATLGLPDDASLAPIRYQLLHRAASAVLEARRLEAAHAVLLVHSFGPESRWFADFASFARLRGVDAQIDRVFEAGGQPVLHLGWVRDDFPSEEAPA